jgi:ABC-type Fe3+/spermidine/putrescine transport system ATPase subunit
MIDLELKDVTKRFGSVVAVNRVSMQVPKGEFLTLLGPSGCGKTTLLRLVAGFYKLDSGEILIRGKTVNKLSPDKRDTAMVFQDYALFPHLSVFENVAFGLRIRKTAEEEIKRRVKWALELVRLPGVEERSIFQLSGGQQQRVAFARAIVVQPEIMLLDEPLSNLDFKLRQAMRIEMRSIQKELETTTIYVTHDQTEALVMSDHIAIMKSGVLEQIGSPKEIYEKPRTPFIADFVGNINFLNGKITDIIDGEAKFTTDKGAVLSAPFTGDMKVGEAILAIRPERCGFAAEAESRKNVLSGQVAHKVYTGSLIQCHVLLDGGERVVVEKQSKSAADDYQEGQKVLVRLNYEDCYLMTEMK